MTSGRHRVRDPFERPLPVTAHAGISGLTAIGGQPAAQPPQLRTESPADAVAVAGRDGALAARSVGYRRNGRTILDDVSVAVAPGTSLAVVGPSGSGKSSLLALMAGLERPDSGTIQGVGAGQRSGLILQGYGLVSVLTAAENVEVTLQAGVRGPARRAAIRDRAAVALGSVGLTAVADHLIDELSGGQQQRVAIARALVLEPSVLFADELTAELDHEWKDRVVDLVLGVAERGGIVVLATHDLQIAARCDRVVRLVDGRVA